MLYSLETGQLVRVIGNATTFGGPQKLCFTSTGNLLVAEWDRQRVQEVTITGDHVRYFGVEQRDPSLGKFTHPVTGIAASSTMVVAVQPHSPTRHIMVYQPSTGRFMMAFQDPDRNECVADNSGHSSVCITPDGVNIIVAGLQRSHLVMITLTGDRTATLSRLPYPSGFTYAVDVCLTSRGQVIAAENRNNRIAVFEAFPTWRLKTVFGSTGTCDGQFQRLIGMAMLPNDVLLTVDANCDRILAFR
jgi:NHL repeat